MNEPVDMVRFVDDLAKRPKAKAAIVFTQDYGGQRQWAADLAGQTEAEHFHMLDIFFEKPELAQRISQFSVSAVFDFISRQSKATVAIVSGIEFIKATWSGQSSAGDEFAKLVQTWNRTPCILFVIQHDATLASYDFGRRYNYRFIIDQRDTFKL